MFQHPLNKLQMPPALQAILAMAESLIISAIIAALVTASQYLSANQQVNLPALLWMAGVAAGISLGHGVAAFFIAKGQQPLGQVLDAFIDQIQARLPQQSNTAQPPKVQSPILPTTQTIPVALPVSPPAQQASQFRSPLPAVNLANPMSTRHFGDTNIQKTVQPPVH